MPSSYSTSLRFELQFTGENINLWGSKLNVALQDADSSIAGWLTKALSGNYTLVSANGSADEARMAMLKFTGTGAFTVTIPSVSKAYDIWNACTDVVTITTGAGTTVAVQPGEIARVICSGSDVKRSQGTYFSAQRITAVADPTARTDAATKGYVDDTAWTYNAGNLPAQSPAVAGYVVKTNGTVAGWAQLTSADLSDTASRDATALGRSVALAVAL